MGGSKKQTIGYRYFMGLHFGLCHGPVDALLEIRGGDRTAWDGNGKVLKHLTGDGPDIIKEEATGAVTESRQITIWAPNLWGGERKEGGIDGVADVMMGEPDQEPNAYLVEQLGTPMPAFRGILSVVFRGMVGAMNPYPKPWAFKVRRVFQGWHGGAAWYPETASVPVIAGATFINDLAFPATQAAEGPYAGITISEGFTAGDVLIVEKPIGLTYKAWSAWPSDSTEAAAGKPWCNRLNISTGAGQELVVWAPWFETPEEAEQYASARRVILSGAESYTFWLEDAPVHDNRGGMSVRVFKGGVSAMNPAHIAYEALTNPEWGLGYPEAVLDLDSFTAAADTFYNEGMGLCGQWARQDTIESFIQTVMDHAGAVLVQDPRTAKFRLVPIRGGYIVGSLPEFRRGLNVIEVQSFERAAVTEATNEITVEYTDVETGKKGSVTIQHLANVQAQGGVASQTVRYTLAPTPGLAQRLGARDLQVKATPLCRARLLVDRSAYGLVPGEVVRWTDEKLGIVDMPMRVLAVDYGNLTDGTIKLDLAEDVFGLPATTYMGQQPGGWEEPEVGAKPSPQVEVLELPYVALHRAEGATVANALDPLSGFLGVAAARAPGINYGFAVYTRVGAAMPEATGAGEWAPGGLLTHEVDPLDTELVLGATYDLDAVEPGELALLGSGPGAELVRIDAVDLPTRTLTVGRGVGDTVPGAWPVGTRLWSIESGMGNSGTEFAAGEEVEASAVTQSPTGELDPDLWPRGTVEMDQRHARPYPPGLFRINGLAYPPSAFGTLTITWAHRDRLLQADQLMDQEAASIGPEPGTTYTLRAYLNGVLVDEQDEIAGTTAAVNPGGNGLVRLELEAVRDGLASWHAQVHEFNYTTAPTNNRVTVDGDRRVTVDGDGRSTIG